MNHREKLIAVFVGCCVTFLAGGVVYGFNPLQKMLTEEGIFASSCDDLDPPPCHAQQLRLNLFFTVSLSSMFFATLPIGIGVDWLGPSRGMIILGVLPFVVACGLLGLATAGLAGKEILFGIGFVLWGVASPGIFLTALSLPKLFPNHSAVVTSCVICLFDASSGVFFIVEMLYEHAGIPFRWLCWGLGILVLVFGLISAILLPRKENVASIDENFLKESLLTINQVEGDEQPLQTFTKKEQQSALQEAWKYATKPKFVAAAGFMSIVSLKNAFFIGTFSSQMNRVIDDAGWETKSNLIFDAVFPLGGILSIPISSALLQRFRTRDDIIFGVILGLALAHAIFNMIPNLISQFCAIATFAILRSLKWSAFSEFVVKHHPLRTIGSLFGLANSLFATVNLLQFAAFAAVSNLCGGNFFPVNLALTIAEAVCIFVPFMLRGYSN